MKACTILLAMAWLAAGSALAADRYVAVGGGNTPPYESWGAASTDLKAAVDVANAADAGETVWVSNGTYVLTASVSVGNTKVRSDSGDPVDVVVDGNGSVRCFYLNHANALVQDLTISNGVADAAPNIWYGGGACVLAGTVSNCVLVGNTGTTLATQPGRGGGAYCGGPGALIAGCSFVTNWAGPKSGTSAGGLFMDDGVAVDCLFRNNLGSYGAGANLNGGGTISNSTFIGNLATGRGGGVLVTVGMVANCLVTGNVADNVYGNGGGVHLNGASAVLMNSTCVWNRTTGAGGGISAGNGLVTNCVVMHNYAGDGPDRGGGGIYMGGSSVVIGCTVISNTVLDASRTYGAGIQCEAPSGKVTDCLVAYNSGGTLGGGAYVNKGGVISNCTFVGNTCLNNGGGAYVSSGMVVNCSMVSNTVSSNYGYGGGVRLNGASTVLMNSTCVWNFVGGRGGGVCVANGVVTNCVLMHNYAGDGPDAGGGGVAMSGNSIVADCTIVSNTVCDTDRRTYGAGILCEATSGQIVDCQIAHNSGGGYGGGISYITVGGAMLVRGCTISSNATAVSDNFGGGVHAKADSSGLLVEDCTIASNYADRGGGIYFYRSASTARCCRIVGNTSLGGPYRHGGGVILSYGGAVVNSLIANNRAWTEGSYGNAGGVCFAGGSGSKLINCTIVNNDAVDGEGGGVYVYSASTTGVLVNCIVTTNKGSAAVNDNWHIKEASSGLVVTNTCTTPSVAAYGPGNITDDPRFENAPGGNYRIPYRSPCFDAGLTESWMLAAADLDGEDRVRGAAVDMGAYEAEPPPGGTAVMIR